MKLYNWTVFSLFLSLSISHADTDTGGLSVYAGIYSPPLETIDFENFHVSDWEQYGLGGAEGRVSLPLSSKSFSGFAPGLTLGATAVLAENFSVFVELAGTLPDKDFFIGELSVGPGVVANVGRLRISMLPRVGYMLGQVDFGQVELIEGTTAPVILSEGTLNVGDDIRADIGAFSYGISGKVDFGLGDVFGIYAEFGYKGGVSDKPEIVTFTEGDYENRTVIPLDSPAIVAPVYPWADNYQTRGNDPAYLAPDIKMQGVMIQIGLTYNL